MKLNVERLLAYKQRLIIFPRKANKPKKGDSTVRRILLVVIAALCSTKPLYLIGRRFDRRDHPHPAFPPRPLCPRRAPQDHQRRARVQGVPCIARWSCPSSPRGKAESTGAEGSCSLPVAPFRCQLMQLMTLRSLYRRRKKRLPRPSKRATTRCLLGGSSGPVCYARRPTVASLMHHVCIHATKTLGPVPGLCRANLWRTTNLGDISDTNFPTIVMQVTHFESFGVKNDDIPCVYTPNLTRVQQLELGRVFLSGVLSESLLSTSPTPPINEPSCTFRWPG